MLPLPPLRFSMMTGWPHFACNLSPTIRASTSLVPPLGYGTRNFTGLVGYASCPNASLGGAIDRMKTKAKAANHRTMGISRPRMPKNTGDKNAKATSNAVAGQGALHTSGAGKATGGEDDAAQAAPLMSGGDANDIPAAVSSERKVRLVWQGPRRDRRLDRPVVAGDTRGDRRRGEPLARPQRV